MRDIPAMSSQGPRQAFSERAFYLQEFRGRTIAFAGEAPDWEEKTTGAIAALREGGARAVVLRLERAGLSADQPALEAAVWRELTARGRAEIELSVGPGEHARLAARLACRLGVWKWVWLDREGGLRRDGRPASFVDGEELERGLAKNGPLAADERRPLWQAISEGLAKGIPAVNVCTAEGLDDELFTYAGSGTLFTRERYVTVRPLGVDDYDAASDLLERGVAEGFLVARDTRARDQLLVQGFGAFVGAHHLAGIGSLIDRGDGRAAEIAGLYTLTRFQGGAGIGSHLVAYAAEEARGRGLAGLFACTTSDAVGGFFRRQGFRLTDAAHIPASKWEPPDGPPYDPARRAKLSCYWLDLTPRLE